MKILYLIKKLKLAYSWVNKSFPLPCEFGKCGSNTILLYPFRISSVKDIYLSENVKVSAGLVVINSPGEKVVIKKNTSVAANCTIVTNSHRSTVSVPQFLLGPSHLNDKSADVIINEDVWVGTNVTILAGVELGRGCIVSAGAVVTKSVPPYALVVGSPARIVKKKFSVNQILEHEKSLYPESERYTKEKLDRIFAEYYQNLGTFGTDEGLTKEALDLLDKLKRQRNYVE